MAHTNELALVTGASGFLGSHIVDQLLKEGYNVRAMARPGKVEAVRSRYTQHAGNLEVIAIEDVVSGDFGLGLKGVTAVVHVASPLPGRGNTESVLDGAVEGALNVLKQAIGSGVKKVVVTSSRAALYVKDKPKLEPNSYDENDWNDTTKEEAIQNGNPGFVYSASKVLAERAVWELAEKHPDVDVTTILPPLLIGSFVPGYDVPVGSTAAMASNELVYAFLHGDPGPMFGPYMEVLDVRDAARAHVLALQAPPAAPGGARKRLLPSAGRIVWSDVGDYLREVRPALSAQLPPRASLPEGTVLQALMDTTRTREVLGIKEFVPWKTFVLDAVDDVAKVEADWASQKK